MSDEDEEVFDVCVKCRYMRLDGFLGGTWFQIYSSSSMEFSYRKTLCQSCASELSRKEQLDRQQKELDEKLQLALSFPSFSNGERV